MRKLNVAITNCPICQHDLHIKQMGCDHCFTEIRGDFNFSKFNYIHKETLYFMEIFIKNRGNIKAIEKEMNISYPTVKKYLDEAIISLGYKLDDDVEEVKAEPINENKGKNNNLDILDSIKKGELKVEEAIEKIKKINKRF